MDGALKGDQFTVSSVCKNNQLPLLSIKCNCNIVVTFKFLGNWPQFIKWYTIILYNLDSILVNYYTLTIDIMKFERIHLQCDKLLICVGVP